MLSLSNKKTVALLTLTLTTSSVLAAEPWRKLQSQHFAIVGQVSDRKLREVAFRLEQFRAALAQLLPDARLGADAPLIVTAFEDEEANERFMPRFQGKRVNIAGLFLPGRDVNHLTLHGETASAFPVVLHEYVHFLSDSLLPNAPLWLLEGLAEYYSTFAVSDRGRRAHVGAVPPNHLRLLRAQPLLPLRELLAVTHYSPRYHQGAYRRMFYAQSWALSHYLLVGNPARTSQLSAYLEETAGGRPPDAAFRLAFGTGPEALTEELRRYLQRSDFRGRTWVIDQPVVMMPAGSSRDWSSQDVDAHLADLSARLARDIEARDRLSRGTASQTTSAGFVSPPPR